jgi:hypothetical protein
MIGKDQAAGSPEPVEGQTKALLKDAKQRNRIAPILHATGYIL